MVYVTADQVRKRLGLTSEDITDEDVLALIDEATAFLSDEIGRTLDPNNCTRGEANAIRNLAAIYAYTQATGGAAAGLNYKIGELSVQETSEPIDRSQQVAFLQAQVERFIARAKRFAPVLGNYEG